MTELTVVIPTLNERENVGVLIQRLRAALASLAWEAVFVDDDSSDGTWTFLLAEARADSRIRCIRRIGRRGLSTAAIEGILSSSSPFAAVMDGDLQHDETLLPSMLEVLRAKDLDVVIGSRYVADGSTDDWSPARRRISRFATRLGKLVLAADLTDPMSGFFLVRRDAFDEAARTLSGRGFKILLDLFASSPRALRFAEVPLRFRPRERGASKLDASQAFAFALLLVDKLTLSLVSARLVLFAVVGLTGVGVHFLVLWASLSVANASFASSQALATFAAMTSNFWLNNSITYRDRRLRGWAFLRGILSFYAICGLGALGNVGLASALFERDYSWWLAGIAGVIVGVGWNYCVTAALTWRSSIR